MNIQSPSLQRIATLLTMFLLTACTNPLLIKHQAEQSSSSSSIASSQSSAELKTMISNSTEKIDPNIDIIKKYYSALSSHEIEKAYDMYSKDGKKKTSFAKFENWYKNIESILPIEIIDFDESHSDYIVFIDLKDAQQPRATYRVLMNVSDRKITTMSSQKIDAVKGKDVIAFIQKQAGLDTVMLVKNQKEIMIKKAKILPKEMGGSCMLKDLTLSSSQKFITVSELCWETSSLFIYNIQKNAITMTLQDLFSHEFIVNDEYLSACANNQFSGTFYANVYKTIDFSLVFDGIKKHNPLTAEQADFGIKCTFDIKKQSVQFQFLDRTIEFSIPKDHP